MTIFPHIVDANKFIIQNMAMEYPIKGAVTKKKKSLVFFLRQTYIRHYCRKRINFMACFTDYVI